MIPHDVVLKTPSPSLTGDNFYTAEFHGIGTGIWCGDTKRGIDRVSEYHFTRINPFELAAGILIAEAQIIDWTAGAWNHEIIGLGTWDGLSDPVETRARFCISEPIAELLQLRFLPVLIMPYHQAIPFSSLPSSSKRQLFPRMLPALWDSLCAMHHGDLSESNILVSQDRNIFHIIDPGVLLTSSQASSEVLKVGTYARDSFANDICVFTTTAENYPIFPPFLNLQTKECQRLEEYLDFERNPIIEVEFRWGHCYFELSGREPDKALYRTKKKLAPSIPDMLALGIMYYRILTGRELFLGQTILPDKPAWQYKFGEIYGDDPENSVLVYKNLTEVLSQNWIENELDKAEITESEKALVYSLLNLTIHSKEQLLRLLTC